MSTGSQRAAELNPSRLFQFIEELIVELRKKGVIDNEVFVRRFTSMLYFALFNYWCGKQYDAGLGKVYSVGGVRIVGRYPYRDFHKYLLRKSLDRYIRLLFSIRVAADHYTLNPTYIELMWNKHRKDIIYIKLDGRKLEIALKYAKIIYKNI